MSLRIFCTARATAMPPIPNPVISPVISIPRLSRASNIKTVQSIVLHAIFIIETELFVLGLDSIVFNVY